jgi:hypothetical protein
VNRKLLSLLSETSSWWVLLFFHLGTSAGKFLLERASLQNGSRPMFFLARSILQNVHAKSQNGGFPLCELGVNPPNQRAAQFKVRAPANLGTGLGVLSGMEMVLQMLVQTEFKSNGEKKWP